MIKPYRWTRHWTRHRSFGILQHSGITLTSIGWSLSKAFGRQGYGDTFNRTVSNLHKFIHVHREPKASIGKNQNPNTDFKAFSPYHFSHLIHVLTVACTLLPTTLFLQRNLSSSTIVTFPTHVGNKEVSPSLIFGIFENISIPQFRIVVNQLAGGGRRHLTYSRDLG